MSPGNGILDFLLPSLRLHTTPWYDTWREEQRRRVVTTSRYTFIFCCIAYYLHIFIDRIAAVEPRHLFLYYRLGMGSVALLLFFLSFKRFFRSSWVMHTLLFAFFFGMSGMQALSMTWSAIVPFFFCALIPLALVIVIPVNTLSSLLFMALAYGWQLWILRNHSVDRSLAFSLYTVSTVILLSFKSRQRLEVENFVNYNTKLEAQRKLIELEQDLNTQIRAFLPREIYRRFEDYLKKGKMTVLQSIDLVLRPKRQRDVVCLFSDIRGFTQGTKAEEDFGERVIFNMRRCTDAVERFSGIPRLIGDLIFAYFDRDKRENLQHSIRAAVDLLDESTEGENDPVIRRYCLLAIGPCYVGNIGGLDSSREITAIGSVVNLLSRVDELTKQPAFQREVSTNQILCTTEYRDSLMAQFENLEWQQLDLPKLGLEIRDFAEVKTLWILPRTERNRQALGTGSQRDSFLEPERVAA